jgi:hypothetical protein
VSRLVSSLLGIAPTSPDELRDEAERILSRPEFAEPGRSWVERVFDRIVEWIDRILSPIFSALGGGGVGSIGGWVLLALVAGALVFVVVKAIRARVSVDAAGSDIAVTTSSARRRLSSSQWRERARSHELAGEWDEAVRCYHRAAVVDLADRVGVSDAAGSTSGQWRETAAANHLADFEPLTDLFEEVWYGSEPADESDAAKARRDPFGATS